jgi:predicted  nucleic acid-binding Zn-ribbon protein
MQNTTRTEDDAAEAAFRARDGAPDECYDGITALYHIAERLDAELDMALDENKKLKDEISDLESEVEQLGYDLKEANERD